ncbi:hypothetical protein D3C86_2037580 [compost metagenome]
MAPFRRVLSTNSCSVGAAIMAMMAMIVMVTMSSIRVKPLFDRVRIISSSRQ